MGKICPVHGKKMARRNSQFGAFYVCEEDGCDVLCGGGETSTPANKETREWRIKAHAALDRVWQENHLTRGQCYGRIREALGTGEHDTHIGMFDVAQCQLVIRFAETWLLLPVQEPEPKAPTPMNPKYTASQRKAKRRREARRRRKRRRKHTEPTDGN